MEPLMTKTATSASIGSSGFDSSLMHDPLNKSSKGARRGPSTSVIACKQCRSRKVRCDSNRPKCDNCVRRYDACEYDVTPKRRGPDRLPGSRNRMYRKKPEGMDRAEQLAKRARAIAPKLLNKDSYDEGLDVTTQTVDSASGEQVLITEELASGGHFESFSSDLDTSAEQSPQGSIFPSAYQAHGHSHAAKPAFSADVSLSPYISRGPSMAFYKQTWWDSLLQLYSPDPSQSILQVYHDLNFLLNNANYWFSFLNLPRFMGNLFDPQRRVFLQPSIVLSALALSTLMQSPEVGLGEEGRKFALWLRDLAQSSLEASLSTSWIEPSLVQAAFFLVLFEASPHPNHSAARTQSAVFLLDSLIQCLSLTKIDADEFDSNTFPANDIPLSSHTNSMISPLLPRQSSENDLLFTGGSNGSSRLEPLRCSCETHTSNSHREPLQSETQPTNRGPAPTTIDASDFVYPDVVTRSRFIQQDGPNTLPGNQGITDTSRKRPVSIIDWPDQSNDGEIQKEESRRLCWSSVALVSALGEYTPHFPHYARDLYITRQENFALYYPGEAVVKQGAKDSIWAIHCRVVLLWNLCQRLRSQPDWNYRRAEFTGKAWMAANEIERAFNRHTCSLGKWALFSGKEYLFQLRMLIGNNFTRLIPLPHTFNFDRDSALEWLQHRDILATFAQKVISFVGRFGPNACSQALAKRPLSVWWLMYQIRTGTLVYKSDPTMHLALRQSLEFLAIIDFLTAMWPSPEQSRYYAEIRKAFLDVCAEAGISVPAPVTITGLPTSTSYSPQMMQSLSSTNKLAARNILAASLD